MSRVGNAILVLKLVAEIEPLLVRRGFAMQGAVLADLTATWLGRQPAELRATILANWLTTVRELTARAEAMDSEETAQPQSREDLS